MEIIVLGSGSSGNCYLLDNGIECLVIEAGISSKKALQEINFDVSRIVGVIVTHAHGDHAKYVNEWKKRKVEVFENLEYNKLLTLGGFDILPFPTVHDCEYSCGFLIKHEEMGKLFFATDTAYISQKFNDLSHVMVECNYNMELLENSEETYKNRVIQTHMGLETCLEFLKLHTPKNVMIIHLSDNHSNANKILTEVNKILPNTNIKIADKGVKMEVLK